MSKKTLLAESIADAMDLKKMAIANAKANLTESFDDALKNMLQSKLDEDADEAETEDEVETETEDEVDEEVDEAKKSEDEDEEDSDETEDEVDEEIDIDAILAEMNKSEDEDETETEDETEDEVDEEIDIDQLLSELGDINEKGDEDEEDEDEEETEVEKEKETSELANLQEQLNKLTKIVNSTNTLNAKLLYFNKLVNESKDLSKEDKIKIVGAFDKATSKSEAKLVYTTLKEAYSIRKKSASKTSLKESLGFGSKASGVASKNKKQENLNESNPFSRMQELAGKILKD